jgi:hypothetical protein
MKTEKAMVRLTNPSRVIRLLLDRGAEELTITLTLLPIGAATSIEIRFLGVSELRFRGERIELNEIVLLLAEDISRNGWEIPRFRVKDYEEEFISFLCREIQPLPPG